jgi:hypothetical protein
MLVLCKDICAVDVGEINCTNQSELRTVVYACGNHLSMFFTSNNRPKEPNNDVEPIF